MSRRRAAALAVLGIGAAGCGPVEPVRAVDGDAEAGRAIVERVRCGVCHAIPGVRGARGKLGPPLAGFAQRHTIGGVAPNHPTLLERWVRDAPSIAPDTLMPPLPLDEREARHVTAFLYTLR